MSCTYPDIGKGQNVVLVLLGTDILGLAGAAPSKALPFAEENQGSFAASLEAAFFCTSGIIVAGTPPLSSKSWNFIQLRLSGPCSKTVDRHDDIAGSHDQISERIAAEPLGHQTDERWNNAGTHDRHDDQ
jgi:hypothetical protein